MAKRGIILDDKDRFLLIHMKGRALREGRNMVCCDTDVR